MKAFTTILIFWSLLFSQSVFAFDGSPDLSPPSVLEQNLSSSGSIGTGAYVIGGLLAIYPGFGIGHIVQGRWLEKGWIFTLSEGIAGTALVANTMGCALGSILSGSSSSGSNWSQMATWYGAFLVFKIWEIGDAWISPKVSSSVYLFETVEHSPGLGLRYSF